MKRGHYTPEGMIEYHKHNIGLMEDGRLSCRELGLVTNTLEEMKAAIRERETKRTKLPKFDVWFKSRWGDQQYQLGTTTGLGVGFRGTEVWVSWKGDRGDNEKKMINADSVYPDTPENRSVIEQINALYRNIRDLNKQIDALHEQLSEVTPIEEP